MSVFGDIEPDDAFDADDGAVDWANVAEVARQIAQINAIGDDAARLTAARKWAAELDGRR